LTVSAWCLTAAPASAEIVHLTTGRTMSVRTVRQEGDAVVLVLRSGGEIVCDRGLIAQVLPDEVPYPEPAAASADAVVVPDAEDTRLTTVPYGDIIDAVATAEGVDPDIVKAVIAVESAYKPRARSPKGAMGLMQLMPATARQYAVKDPYDPRANVAAGVKHLKSLMDRFDLRLALAAYNAGEGAVQRFGGIPPYRETRAYVSRIMRLLGTRRSSD
jgi:soluble lytic murein transglycosylase-like protein